MNLVGPVRDRVRTLLKIRVVRDVPSVGSKPAIGARIFRGDVRMTVQAGMTDGLWRWLVKEGWREITFRPDRRRYRDIPAAYVTQPDRLDCGRTRPRSCGIASPMPVGGRCSTGAAPGRTPAADPRSAMAGVPSSPIAGRHFSEFRVGDTFRFDGRPSPTPISTAAPNSSVTSIRCTSTTSSRRRRASVDASCTAC